MDGLFTFQNITSGSGVLDSGMEWTWTFGRDGDGGGDRRFLYDWGQGEIKGLISIFDLAVTYGVPTSFDFRLFTVACFNMESRLIPFASLRHYLIEIPFPHNPYIHVSMIMYPTKYCSYHISPLGMVLMKQNMKQNSIRGIEFFHPPIHS